MKFQTIFYTLILLTGLNLSSCGAKNPSKTPATVEQAEAKLAKARKKKSKQAAKAKKKAEKHFWSLQSKAVKKRIKRSNKKQKRL